MINSSLYKDSSDAKFEYDEQNNWLLNELNKIELEKPIHTILFGHIPPFIINAYEEND